MSHKHRNRIGPGWITTLVTLGLIDLGLLMRYLLADKNVTLLNPQGFISHQQHNLFILLLVLLFVAAVPVILFLYFVAWKFRESNTTASHTPEKRDSKSLAFSIWAYPILFFFVFAAILIPVTHRLEPRKAIAAADAEPLTIQVIALRWKWLFLYPEQNIASLNFVQLPVDRPVKFELTADNAPMSSFWIPNIGGQLYAMTGHSNPLHLLPEKIGNFPGSSAEINGPGFADMTFTASVSSASDFDTWVDTMRQSGTNLDTQSYAKLIEPSEAVPTAFYGKYPTDLYDSVLAKYMGHMHSAASEEHEHEHGGDE